MILMGFVFIGTAVGTFIWAKPRHGVVKLAAQPLLGDILALGIAAGGAIGLVLTLIGIGNL